MASVQWNREKIITDFGQNLDAIAPVIISASRATDIPAFYPDWFIRRIRAGYVRWVNPFNGNAQYVSFSKARLIVFWTKNPTPVMPFLDEIESRGLNYFFHITLNDYEMENYEPFLPSLEKRVESFISLSERIGPQKVHWRFDPLLITDTVSPEKLVEKVLRVGEMIHRYTSRLTVSFFSPYQKVLSRCRREGVKLLPTPEELRRRVLSELSKMAQEWHLKICTCADGGDYSDLGIMPGRCIDENHLVQTFSDDFELVRFLDPSWQPDLFGEVHFRKGLRDTGQRQFCGCVKSKDIGRYNTCPHGCLYCYANSGIDRVKCSEGNSDAL